VTGCIIYIKLLHNTSTTKYTGTESGPKIYHLL